VTVKIGRTEAADPRFEKECIMAAWLAEIFADQTDEKPQRRALIQAATEEEAFEKVSDLMENAVKAMVLQVRPLSLEPGQIVWL
jgi:hypothetical protein